MLLEDLRTSLRKLAITLLILVGFKAGWFGWQRATPGEDAAELLERRAYLVERVTAPDFGPRSFPEAMGDPFRGEWALVSLSMTALALGGLAQQFPAEVGTTESDLQKIIDRTLSTDVTAFDTDKWNKAALDTLASDHGHIGYLGHLTLILAVDELTSPKGPHRELLGRVAPAIARKIARAPCGIAETYPGELYLPDNAVALAALALAERAGIAPAEPALSARNLLEKIEKKYADPTTGLLPFRLTPACASTGELRASGAAWSLLYLAHVDEAHALQGYEALRKNFLDQPVPGLLGVREWPRGVDRSGDVDSGPLALGLSPAATGFTVALARRAGDQGTLRGLLDTAELAGFSLSWRGRRGYLTAPLVGDAILLAARAPLRPAMPSSSPSPSSSSSSSPSRPALPLRPAASR
jgi:hypothetical protein